MVRKCPGSMVQPGSSDPDNTAIEFPDTKFGSFSKSPFVSSDAALVEVAVRSSSASTAHLVYQRVKGLVFIGTPLKVEVVVETSLIESSWAVELQDALFATEAFAASLDVSSVRAL